MATFALACGNKKQPSERDWAAALASADFPAAPIEDEGECSAAHPGGCQAAAKAIASADPAKAVALGTIGCNGGSRGSCVNLGIALEYGRGASKDIGRARELFARACAMGSPWGCNDFAYSMNEDEPVNHEVGYLALVKACEGLPYACLTLANAEIEGIGTAVNVEKGASRFREMCEKKQGGACVRLGQLMRLGTVRDPDATFGQWFEKGCALDNGDGCAYAGVGHLADPKSAIPYFEKGCGLKSGAACYQLGAYFSDGLLVPVDKPRALEAYRKACALKEVESCGHVKALEAAGVLASGAPSTSSTPSVTGSAAPSASPAPPVSAERTK